MKRWGVDGLLFDVRRPKCDVFASLLSVHIGYIMRCRKAFRIFLGVQIRVTPCKYMNFLNMFQIKF